MILFLFSLNHEFEVWKCIEYFLGDEKIIGLLVQNGADINQKDNNGTTNLHSATYLGDVKTVETLVRNLADVNIENRNGETALHIASFIGKLIDLLIKKKNFFYYN